VRLFDNQEYHHQSFTSPRKVRRIRHLDAIDTEGTVAFTTANICSVFQRTLDNLGVDYVDAYLLHHPYFAKSKEELQAAWAEIEDIYDSGKVGEIGVSNCTPEHIETILETARIKPTLNQVELNPYLQRVQLQQYHKEHGIQTVAFSPLSPIVRAHPGPLDDPLKALSGKHGVSTAVILIRWAVQQNIAVVTTSTDPERMKDHLRAMDFVLSDDEIELISRVGSTKHFRGRWTNIFAEDDRR
jgi:diketogulonate reductase-like aldo/keto reductase